MDRPPSGNWNCMVRWGSEAKLDRPVRKGSEAQEQGIVEGKDYPDTGWTWAYDSETPTNRRVAVPYDKETSLTTVIDCYLLSPNIKLEHVKTVDVGFAHSDHQPVELIVQLQ